MIAPMFGIRDGKLFVGYKSILPVKTVGFTHLMRRIYIWGFQFYNEYQYVNFQE